MLFRKRLALNFLFVPLRAFARELTNHGLRSRVQALTVTLTYPKPNSAPYRFLPPSESDAWTIGEAGKAVHDLQRFLYLGSGLQGTKRSSHRHTLGRVRSNAQMIRRWRRSIGLAGHYRYRSSRKGCKPDSRAAVRTNPLDATGDNPGAAGRSFHSHTHLSYRAAACSTAVDTHGGAGTTPAYAGSASNTRIIAPAAVLVRPERGTDAVAATSACRAADVIATYVETAAVAALTVARIAGKAAISVDADRT
jgi:hypothetical protein